MTILTLFFNLLTIVRMSLSIHFEFSLRLHGQGLDANVANSWLVLTVLTKFVDTSRLKEKFTLAMSYVTAIAHKVVAFAHSNGGFDISFGRHVLKVNSAGCVTNFQEVAYNIHGTVGKAWKEQWDAMTPSSLTCPWSTEHLPFLDVVTFATQALRSRKAAKKRTWEKARSGLELKKLVEALVEALKSMLHLFIYQNYDSHLNKQVPARRLRWAGAALTDIDKK